MDFCSPVASPQIESKKRHRNPFNAPSGLLWTACQLFHADAFAQTMYLSSGV